MVILDNTLLVEADTTIFGHFLWVEMEGCTYRAWPIQPIKFDFREIVKMALFNPCMQLKVCWSQMTLFDVAKNSI